MTFPAGRLTVKRFRMFVMLVILLAAAGTACSPQAPQPGDGLFFDDFSETPSGWGVWQGERSSISYDSGGLRFRINERGYDFWAMSGKRFSDSRIEVDAQAQGGPQNNDFGIICRYQDRENFYGFIASSDQYYGIFKMVNGEYRVLNPGGELQVSKQILSGAKLNRLRADCAGSRLALYVNSEKLLEVQDSDFTEGEAGLMAGAFDTAGVDVLFDNFTVVQP